MEELKERAREELLCSSDVFKADPFSFLFLCFSLSLHSLSSLLCSFLHHLSEVSIAAGHSVVDLDFLFPFVNCV